MTKPDVTYYRSVDGNAYYVYRKGTVYCVGIYSNPEAVLIEHPTAVFACEGEYE